MTLKSFRNLNSSNACRCLSLVLFSLSNCAGGCLAVWLLPSTVAAQALFAPVEYVTGDREWKCHGSCLGTLALDDQSITLTERRQKNARVIFSLPISTIVNVTNRVESTGPNATAIAALGVLGLASGSRDELIVITAETDARSETFVFKVAKNTSDGMVAKIVFAAKKGRAE